LLLTKSYGFVRNAERKSILNNMRLKERFAKEVTPVLTQEFGIKNKMAVPSLVKVVINCGIGKGMKDEQAKEQLIRDLTTIAGQKPSTRLAKVSISAFNLRMGMPVGLAVTLRGARMYDFLERLFSIVLPRLRDFRGVKLAGIDSHGNYTLGLPEHTVFPEIDLARAATPHGLEITIVTSENDPVKSKRLLELLGMPFAKDDLAQGKLGRKSS
jgi:large subunit ribosomal protein L5